MTASFSCPQCKATFGRSAHLRRHQKTHRAEKPYVCQFCSVASSRKDVIVRHTKNFHRNPVQPARTPKPSRDSASSTPASDVVPDDSDASSRGHPPPPQAPQAPLQLVAMDNVALDYTINLDLFDFGPPEFHDARFHDAPMPNMLADPSTLDPLPASSSAKAWCEKADYASARANLALYDLNNTLFDFRFPSRHAVQRSVQAFFKHMAPHMPIVHKPTFRLADAASPLLMEIVACGALYLGEHTTAATMHAAAQRLVFQMTQYEPYNKDGKFQLWMLQTYLLISFFGAYGGNLDMQERSSNVFPYAIKLAQDALRDLDVCPALTYSDWVYQETISRCITSAIEIGAGLASTDQCFTVPFLDASLPLPSHAAAWHEDEIAWHGYSRQPNSRQVLSVIFSGQEPTSSISDLGLVALVSMLLWRVCSFKSLTNSHHLDPYTDFVENIERAFQILDTMLENLTPEELPNPLRQSARSQLDSAIYHLYGSKSLTEMKSLVESPGEASISGNDYSPKLHLALIRAAEALLLQCRIGLHYIRRMASHHFSPICAIACYEGGLLLTWYLITKPSLLPGLASTARLDRLIEESLAEIDGLGVAPDEQRPTLPLFVVAKLLSNRSVWQWPCSVSEKVKKLAQVSRETPFHSSPLHIFHQQKSTPIRM